MRQEVLHGLGRRPCQRAGQPVGRADRGKYKERLPRVITDKDGVQWRSAKAIGPTGCALKLEGEDRCAKGGAIRSAASRPDRDGIDAN